eukprot:m.263942 g.263942  ORF g.263942 m.263942 type:complete len:249 (+) comp55233_c0_seq1:30-776(+)
MTNTEDSALECAAVMRRTRCYPKKTLTPPALNGLSHSAAETVDAQMKKLGLDVTVQSARMFPGSNMVHLVLQASSEVTLAAGISAIDVSSFFTPTYCSSSLTPTPQEGFAVATKRVRFLLVDCAYFGQDVIDDVLRSVSSLLSTYGVRGTDVTVSRIGCEHGGSASLDIHVSVVEMFEDPVRRTLDSLAYWTSVYESLVQRQPAVFVNLPEVLEYNPGAFAPPEPEDDLGSGSGSGSGSGFGADDDWS